jgi:UDP-2,3-diacylglucosamine pyrophosphatase LpxH
MLVVISDLHLVDGTAGNHNVSAEAYQLWIDEIVNLAETQHATELIFLYTGDVFDLIRTEAWFDVELRDRPWGNPAINENPSDLSAACRQKAHAILDHVASATKEQLDILGGRAPIAALDRLARLNIPVRRAFVPGNHDRLYLVDDGLRGKINRWLGIGAEPMEGLSPHRFLSRDYGLLARHGHEFDVWNFEGRDPEALADRDYLKVPIGDVICTELVARFPWAIRRELVAAGIAPDVVDGVATRLQDIEDVRPMHAAVQWIYYTAAEIREKSALPPAVKQRVTEIIEDTIPAVYGAFLEMPFVRAWLAEHDRWTTPFDEADKLKALGVLLRHRVSLTGVQLFCAAFEKLGLLGDDSLARAALDEKLLQDPRSGIHYVTYGHTHTYEQVALRQLEGHEKIYFNSGTWRPRHVQAKNRQDFVGWKEMAYLVFYNEREDPLRRGPGDKGVSFETWSGTMLKSRR